MRRFKYGVIALVIALLGMTLASTAQAHEPVGSASQVCDEATGDITLTATFDNPGFQGETTVTATDSQAGSLGTQTAPATFSTTVPGPDRAVGTVTFEWSASDGDSGTVTADYEAVSGCLPPPVEHNPTLSGEGVCEEETGEYVVTYTGDADGGTADVELPLVRRLPGDSTSDSLTVTFSYEDGPDQVRTVEVTLAGDCEKPSPPPPDEDEQPPSEVKATFQGGGPDEDQPAPPAQPQAKPAKLPFTGEPVVPLALLGTALLAAGIGLRRLGLS
jgi:hypothetical protein